MSSFSKMLSIIDLFSEEHPVWTAEAIAEYLDVSIPTAYRYLKELNSSGIIARNTGGLYILGPKIIELDYQIRTSDPTILVGKPIMQNVRDKTGGEVLLSQIYNDRILIIHEERIEVKLNITFARGRSHPLFQSATAKIILANLPAHQLEKLKTKYQLSFPEGDWKAFKRKLVMLRRNGYCVSHGEIDRDLTSIATPIFNNQQIRGSLSFIIPTNRYELFDQTKLINMLVEAAKEITKSISSEEN